MSNSVFGYLSDRLAYVVSRALPIASENVVVTVAGLVSARGTYSKQSTLFGGRPWYVMQGGDYLIRWESVSWFLYDVNATTTPLYESVDNVASPDLGVWTVVDGTSPAPVVSVEAPTTFVETRNGLTTEDITYPLVYCYAGEATEVMTPGCGVFNVPVTLTYAEKADDITADAFDENWQTLLRYLWDSSLPSTLTTTGFHVHGITYGPQTESIENDERAWARSATLEVRCMPRSNS